MILNVAIDVKMEPKIIPIWIQNDKIAPKLFPNAFKMVSEAFSTGARRLQDVSREAKMASMEFQEAS